jgi:hypothetical protein
VVVFSYVQAKIMLKMALKLAVERAETENLLML